MRVRTLHIPVALLLMISLVFGMLCQYHHHDCQGNVYIGLTLDDDIALGNSDNLHSHCCGHHNHERVPSEKRNCSLHIDQFISLLDSFDKHHVVVKSFNNDLFLSKIKGLSSECPVLLYVDNSWLADFSVEKAGYHDSNTLRAPPVM